MRRTLVLSAVLTVVVAVTGIGGGRVVVARLRPAPLATTAMMDASMS